MPPKHLATIKDLAFSVPEEVSEASSFLYFVAIPSENGGHEECALGTTLRGNYYISRWSGVCLRSFCGRGRKSCHHPLLWIFFSQVILFFTLTGFWVGLLLNFWFKPYVRCAVSFLRCLNTVRCGICTVHVMPFFDSRLCGYKVSFRIWMEYHLWIHPPRTLLRKVELLA